MTYEWRRLTRWLRRAAPPRGVLLRALVAGVVASAVNVALLVGAVALLVESALRPGLHTVLGALIVIELLAFLRSPLRFVERLSAHRLGFSAVSRWRRWLVVTVGGFSFTRWRSYAAGDLLERALRDTDELQELWLRGVIPLVTAATVMSFSDLVIGCMAPHGRWWAYAGDLFAIQLLGIAALLANAGPLLRRDHVLRRARAHFRAQLVELSAATPELDLIGRSDFSYDRAAFSAARLRRAEARMTSQHAISNAIPPAMTALALAALVVRPDSAGLWVVVAALLAVATYESLNVVRDALDTIVAVSAAAERLEELAETRTVGRQDWPGDTTIRLDRVSVVEDGDVLVDAATWHVEPGRRVALTGASGVGKTTLLRAIAALDGVVSGTVSIGGVAVNDLDETQLRQRVAYVASEPGLTRGFVIDVVGLGRATTRHVHHDLARLGIVTDVTTRWEELSRGERARVALARAVVTDPAIYLLDEPTSGLGTEETALVLDLLAPSGATVIIATHDPQVMKWCDEVVELADAALRSITR